MRTTDTRTSKQKPPRRTAAMGALLAAAAAALMQPAVAGQMPLVDWNQFSAPAGTASSLKPCTTAPTSIPGSSMGHKGRAHGMYQFIKYGAAPPQPTLSTWQATADCVAGTPPPPAPVIPPPELDLPDTDEPLPPEPPRSSGSPIEDPLVDLISHEAEVPPTENEAPAQPGQAVPEPASGWLMGLGLLAAWGVRRRRAASPSA